MQEQLSFDAPAPVATPPARPARAAAARPSRGPAARPAPVAHTGSAPVAGSFRTVVYTDGACSGNPGPGGWAWAVPDGAWARGAEAQSTNQRMELQAVLEAVRALDGSLEVVSDSTYVVNCFRDKWWAGWRRRDWRNSQNKPVANRDLWEPLIELVLARDVTFRWVKGHATDPVNGFVDRLAVESARTQTAGHASSGTPAIGSGAAGRQSPSKRP
jgi:ribonuclease HI